MNARDIQRRLIVDRYQHSFVLHNYTPAKWWECDVFEITKAGFFREYEIKMSLSDFRADAAKQKEEWTSSQVEGRWKMQRTPGQKKHAMLADCSAIGPVQFWFVCPEGLIPNDAEFPDWAGLIYMRAIPAIKTAPYNVREYEVKTAPRLHRQKISPGIETHARGVCYYRLHRFFCHSEIETESEA